MAGDFDGPTQELYRIRIRNSPGGFVQVSTDAGRTYSALGRVKFAANARIIGFAAASYVPEGTVAATSVHGIRIKTGQSALGIGKAQKPFVFSVTPAEYAVIPRGYGGHQPRSSSILTDIHAGHAIFRNLSPFAGSPVFIEDHGSLRPLPEDYIPEVGKVYVIQVLRPVRVPSEIDFDNRAGGKVTVIWPDGSTEVIADVDRPMRGIGRYDGTTFTGVGAVNTNHGGVITLSTAPLCPEGTKEGGDVETRGGFMIQPYYHVCEQGETSPQVMVVGPNDRTKPALEGTPPLFRGYIGLAYFPGHLANSYRFEVRIDDGDWEPPPALVGKIDNALTAGYLTQYFQKLGRPREIRQGVTAVRLLFPVWNADLVARELAAQAAECARIASPKLPSTKGVIQLSPRRASGRKCVVRYYVDGVLIYTSNAHPYEYSWDSTKVPNGLHEIETEITPESGGEPVTERRQVLVKN